MIDFPTYSDIEISDGHIVFLCEGKDEAAVLRNITGAWSRKPKIGTPKNGKNGAKEIEGFVSTAKLQQFSELKIGIVGDAEGDASVTEKNFKRWLRAGKLTPPSNALNLSSTSFTLESGVVLTIHASYLINPHGKQIGKIEDLFLPQIMAHGIWPCIDAFITCANMCADSRGSNDKVVIRSFVGYLDASSSTIHAGMVQGFLDASTPEFDEVASFAASLRAA